MTSIIYKVTELDKKMRNKVKELEDIKESLPSFLREQKKEMIAKKQLEAKQEIKDRKHSIKKSIEKTEKEADKRLHNTLEKIQDYYDKYKDEWIEKIYKQCVIDYMEE